MPIPISREDFNLAMHEINERLERIEQALLELNKPAPKEVKKPIVKKGGK